MSFSRPIIKINSSSSSLRSSEDEDSLPVISQYDPPPVKPREKFSKSSLDSDQNLSNNKQLNMVRSENEYSREFLNKGKERVSEIEKEGNNQNKQNTNMNFIEELSSSNFESEEGNENMRSSCMTKNSVKSTSKKEQIENKLKRERKLSKSKAIRHRPLAKTNNQPAPNPTNNNKRSLKVRSDSLESNISLGSLSQNLQDFDNITCRSTNSNQSNVNKNLHRRGTSLKSVLRVSQSLGSRPPSGQGSFVKEGQGKFGNRSSKNRKKENYQTAKERLHTNVESPKFDEASQPLEDLALQNYEIQKLKMILAAINPTDLYSFTLKKLEEAETRQEPKIVNAIKLILPNIDLDNIISAISSSTGEESDGGNNHYQGIKGSSSKSKKMLRALSSSPEMLSSRTNPTNFSSPSDEPYDEPQNNPKPIPDETRLTCSIEDLQDPVDNNTTNFPPPSLSRRHGHGSLKEGGMLNHKSSIEARIQAAKRIKNSKPKAKSCISDAAVRNNHNHLLNNNCQPSHHLQATVSSHGHSNSTHGNSSYSSNSNGNSTSNQIHLENSKKIKISHCIRCHKNYDTNSTSAINKCQIPHPQEMVVKLQPENDSNSDFQCLACNKTFNLVHMNYYEEKTNAIIAGFCFDGSHTNVSSKVKYRNSGGTAKTCEENGCVEFYV